jgi:serine protease
MRIARAAAATLALAASGVLWPGGAPSEDLPRGAGAPHALPLPAGSHSPDELIVVFRDGTDERDMERTLRAGGATGGRRSRFGPRVLARLEPGADVPEAASRFAALAGVAWAEPNGLIWVDQAVTFAPNDTFYRFQWNLKQVNAERTWGIQKGKSSVAVAVLDSGVAFENYVDPRTGQQFRKAPDWGDTRFLPGYDFFNDDAHPNDDRDHGTHVASTIAEATNNGLGVAGLAFGCSIMPVKVLGANGVGTFFALADGIDYATSYTENGQRPVKVINLSLSSSSFNQTVKAAIDRAAAAGVLVVASAGNNGASSVNFPADQENVVAVGATNAAKQKAWYSNTGPELDFVAPGGDCERDDDGDGSLDCVYQQTMRRSSVVAGRYDDFGYFGFQGTSMAAPHVSAAAALLFSQGFTDAAAVRKALEQTAERLGGAPPGGRNDTFGYGLIQPAAALPGYGLTVGTRP